MPPQFFQGRQDALAQFFGMLKKGGNDFGFDALVQFGLNPARWPWCTCEPSFQHQFNALNRLVTLGLRDFAKLLVLAAELVMSNRGFNRLGNLAISPAPFAAGK